jgi:hypothetical protein
VAAKGTSITQSPTAPALPNCDDGKSPDKSVGTGNPAQTGELLACVAAFESRQFDPNGPCPWFKTPSEPQPKGSARKATARAAVFDPGFHPVVPVMSEGYIDKRSDLSGVSCAQWNAAGDDGRDWLVRRIRDFAGGVVNDQSKIVGYGDTLTDEQAHELFDTWCPQRYAQGFVLYKLYTYAAAVSTR